MKKPINFGPKKKSRQAKPQDPDALVTFWLSKVPQSLKTDAENLRVRLGYTRREMVKRAMTDYIEVQNGK